MGNLILSPTLPIDTISYAVKDGRLHMQRRILEIIPSLDNGRTKGKNKKKKRGLKEQDSKDLNRGSYNRISVNYFYLLRTQIVKVKVIGTF